VSGAFGTGASGSSPPARKVDFTRYFPANTSPRRTAPIGTTFKVKPSAKTKDRLIALRNRLRVEQPTPQRRQSAPMKETTR
jgi:hypothetical protein